MIHYTIIIIDQKSCEKLVLLTLLCPDHLTRHDMSIEESIGEAGYQYCIQWLFYFVVVSHAARDEDKDRTLFSDSLHLTTITSIISLSTGQFKVFRPTRTSYSSIYTFDSPSSLSSFFPRQPFASPPSRSIRK